MAKIRKLIKILLRISLAAVIMLIGFAAVLAIDAARVKLDISKLEGGGSDIVFYDSGGSVISANILKNKKPGGRLNDYTYNAFIAVEDKRFYTHKGIDVKRMAKAALNNLKSFSFREGASTITQQLIKNTQLSRKKTIFRKTREIKLALEAERLYSKRQIIDMYLTNIYFGSGCYGIENAALYYFNKPAGELSLNESAALAAVIKAPSAYSPYSNYKKLIARKDVVLKKMYQQKYISEEEFRENSGKDIVLCNAKQDVCEYDDYIRECLNEVSEVLNIPLKELYSQNLKIYTYMDAEKQIMLHNLVNNNDYYKDGKGTDAAALILDNNNFSLVAVSIKSNLGLSKIIRQPGSVIKPPLVYAPALEYNIISPATEILDEKINFGDYRPSNYKDKYYGWVDAKTCLSKSLNIPSVKIFSSVGCEKAKAFAARCGIGFSEKDSGLGLALGGFYQGVPLKELAASYIPFSNGGYYKKPRLIKKITDGGVLYENNSSPQAVMRDDTAYLISDMLKESVKSGTAAKLGSLDIPLCSKTGTVGCAGYNTDAYNISYTAENTFAVWMGGINDNKLDISVTGGTYPTAMVKDIIKKCYVNHKPRDFVMPDSVVYCDIDLENLKRNHTLKLATEFTPERYVKKMLFSAHFVPREYSDCFALPHVEECDVTVGKGSVTIKFSAKNYLSYQIIRADDKSEEIIETVQNKEGDVAVTDKSITCGKTYRYYIVPQFVNNSLKKTIKGKTYMSNKIVVPYKFSPEDDFDDEKYDDEYDDEKWWQDDRID